MFDLPDDFRGEDVAVLLRKGLVIMRVRSKEKKQKRKSKGEKAKENQAID
ncbi:MAG: hypothetical protein WBH09_09475 [Rugosibacter sp.]